MVYNVPQKQNRLSIQSCCYLDARHSCAFIMWDSNEHIPRHRSIIDPSKSIHSPLESGIHWNHCFCIGPTNDGTELGNGAGLFTLSILRQPLHKINLFVNLPQGGEIQPCRETNHNVEQHISWASVTPLLVASLIWGPLEGWIVKLWEASKLASCGLASPHPSIDSGSYCEATSGEGWWGSLQSASLLLWQPQGLIA